jgi:hypothetical protein
MKTKNASTSMMWLQPKVKTCSLISKSFDNILNIDKTQQKSVNLVNFPVSSRISLANKSEMCSPSGHKEEVTRSSVMAAPSNSESQMSVLFNVKDTEQETLAVHRAMLAASANAEFKNIVDIHKISARKTPLEEHHKNATEPKCTAINSSPLS